MKRSALVSVLCALSLGAAVAASTNGDELKETHVVNGTDWLDTEGRPIMAHEGDLARFDGVF
jgi:hypothetical protein